MNEQTFGPVIPVLRIFDVAKAREFYSEFLGFAIDWEHTFDDHSPVYLQVSREGALLHLSEHHADASPGATVRILVADVVRLHRELHEREYRYARPGIETMPWGLEVAVTDPFANRLVFHQLVDDVAPTEGGGAPGKPEDEPA
jgi:catechol 2,3-dioxygenase-like lactoylglutathione lyase family enzyme